MTLPPRHRIPNSNPGNLRPSTPPFGHGDSQQLDVIFIVAQLVGDIYLDLISQSFIQNILVTSIICAFICVASRQSVGGIESARNHGRSRRLSSICTEAEVSMECHCPENTRRATRVVLMLDRRRRRCASIKHYWVKTL